MRCPVTRHVNTRAIYSRYILRSTYLLSLALELFLLPDGIHQHTRVPCADRESSTTSQCLANVPRTKGPHTETESVQRRSQGPETVTQLLYLFAKCEKQFCFVYVAPSVVLRSKSGSSWHTLFPCTRQSVTCLLEGRPPPEPIRRMTARRGKRHYYCCSVLRVIGIYI